tara:strand:- start:8847 stop:9596 length:750 start_codon:yes stop_codon:yes gene_type:complete
MDNYINTLFSLEGKTAIITGGSRGIGAQISKSFLKANANIVCMSRSMESNHPELQNFYKQCDINDDIKFREICMQTYDSYKGIDILVNAAGISLPTDNSISKFELFSKTLDVNLISTYKCCEIASEFMSDGGSIINVTSIGSFLAFPDNPGYVSSKGGLRSLTKALAEDLSAKEIRVNNIAPGYIRTDMTEKSFSDSALNQQRIDRMMIKRWGTVEDISAAAIFLASDASSYITGTDIIVDGGWTAKGI